MTATRTFLDSVSSDGASATAQILNVNTSGAKALVFAAKMEDGTTTLLTLTDNQGNTWEKIGEIDNNTNSPRVALWWCPNPTTSASDHDFTVTANAADATYWRCGVWKIDAGGQVVLDDWSEATGSGSSNDAGSIARIADAVHMLIVGEFSAHSITNQQGWTLDASPGGYTRLLSRYETSNGLQSAAITVDVNQFAAIAASFREIPTAQFVKRDTFTVGSDIALNSYPSGAAEWSTIMGSGLQVNAARDRVESQFGGDNYSYFSGAGAPQGRQRIALQMGWTANGAGGGILVRCNGTSGGNAYFVGRTHTTAWQIWRVVNGDWGGAAITELVKSTPDAGRGLVSLEAETNGSQVTLRLIIDGELFTYNDTSGARLLSGSVGIGAYQGSVDSQNYVDNVVIEDLDAGASPPPHARAYGPQGYLRTLIGM